MPVERSDNTGTAMLFEAFLLEQKGRVQQPPKMRKIIGGPFNPLYSRGKIDPERETDRGI